MNEVQSPWKPQPDYDTEAVTAITKEAGKIGRKIGKEIIKTLKAKELTWHDIKAITNIEGDIYIETDNDPKKYSTEEVKSTSIEGYEQTTCIYAPGILPNKVKKQIII